MKLKMIESSDKVELGQTKWRTKIDDDWSSLSEFWYKDFITKPSGEDKNINLRLTDLKYAGADHDGITYSQLKKWILKLFSTTKRNAKKDPTRRPKNLPHFNFEDERCKYSTFTKEESFW